MDHFYSGLLFLIVLQQGSGHDSPDSFFSSESGKHSGGEIVWEIVHEIAPDTVVPADTMDSTGSLFLIQDDFEHSEWPYSSANPVRWRGDLDHFRLQSENSTNTVLRLDAPFAGYSALYAEQVGAIGQWRATIYQDFTPSNTNQTWFYLMADQPLESATVNGYALRFGESGTEKRIRLFRLDQGNPKEISRVPLSISEGGIEVRVMRDAAFNWVVEARRVGDEKWEESRVIRDATYQMSLYSGFYFTYTTTRTDKFWIDQVDIRTFPAALSLESAVVRNQSHLELEFNQPVMTLSSSDVVLIDSMQAEFQAESLQVNEARVQAYFSPLPDGRYELALDAFQNVYGSGIEEKRVYLELENSFRILQASITDAHHLHVLLSQPVDPSKDIRQNIFLSNENLSDKNPESVTISGVMLGNGYPLHLRFDEPIEYGVYVLRLGGVKDQSGWLLRDSLYVVYRYYSPGFGDLQINEILFNPLADPEDGYADQTQYLELHNTTPYPISAGGLFYHKGEDETGAIRPYSVSCEGCSRYAPEGVIPPKGYVLVYPEPEAIGFESSRLGRFLLSVREDILAEAGQWPFPVRGAPEMIQQDASYDGDTALSLHYPASVLPLRYEAKTLSLTNNGGLLILQKKESVLDSVFYSEEWHHRALPVNKGYALERIQSTLSGLRKDNWGTSTGWIGGTPGWENSISTRFSSPDFQDQWLIASPDPFSPNDDGFEDHLQISYQLGSTDYVLRIRIYDIEGRLIRHLFLGRAGRDGTLIWDGRNDQGARIPEGLYILLAEATGSETGRQLQRKVPLIVAGAARIP